MTQDLDLTNDALPEPRGIDIGADWAFAFAVGGSVITAINVVRMEIRRTESKNSPVIASFYSDGTGTGACTIDELTVTVELPATVTDADGWTFHGQARYDLFVTYQGGKEIKLLRGAVDINLRVTQ